MGVAVTTALLPRGSRFGDIKLTGYLGSGGFSDVYAGQDSSGRRLAVKVLRLTGLNAAQQTQRVRREQEALARVDSRGVAKLISADLTADQPWIASEFVDGPTLKESIETQGPLTFDETLGLIRRLAEIVAELHELGIAHRDITPNNIIFGPDGPVLIDFGSARIDLENEATGSILLAGTPGFTPPEAEAGLAVGKKADVYALGQLAIYCLGNTDLPETLTQAKATDPEVRPTANELAASLTPHNTTPARNTTRNIRQLPRRYSLLTVSALLLGTATVSMVAAGLLLRSGPVMTVDLLDLSDIGSPSVAAHEGLLSIDLTPADWTVARKRPADTILGGDAGVLESVQAFRDHDVGDGSRWGYELFEAQLVLDLDRDASNEPVPPSVEARTDRLLDRFERSFVPDGCVLTRAELPAELSDGSLVIAGHVENCAADSGVYTGGTIWREDSVVVVEWLAMTTEAAPISDLLKSLKVAWGYGPTELSGPSSWMELVNLTSAPIDFGPPGLAEEQQVEFGHFAVRLDGYSAVELVADQPVDAQVSAVILSSTDKSYRWTPGGRWWVRGEGERRIFANPFATPSVVVFEIEGIWDGEAINLTVQPAHLEPIELSIANSLDGTIPPEAEVIWGESDRRFALPSNPGGSTDSVTETASFRLRDTSLPVTTDLLIGVIETGDVSTVLRADETYWDYELSYLELHDPHWLIAFAPAMEYLVMNETSDWVTIGEVGTCDNETEWLYETGNARVQVRAALDCNVYDSYSFLSTGSFTPQTNPVFYFSIGSVDEEDDWVAGSFAPGSIEELNRFKIFLADIFTRADEIATAFTWGE